MKKILTSGKRKRSVARAVAEAGTGIVHINKVPLELIRPTLVQMRMQEPLLLADDIAKKIDIHVIVNGGGFSSQAEASRLAIAKALVEFSKSDALKNKFVEYDRHLLIADVRRKETRKPNDSKARAKRQKSYR